MKCDSCGYEDSRVKCVTCGHIQDTALPPVRTEPVFSLARFRSVLVKHGIIYPESIEDAELTEAVLAELAEDAEGFDGECTLAATRDAYHDLIGNGKGADR